VDHNGRQAEANADPSIARLLDQLRQLLIDAWEQDQLPDYALVHPALYRAVSKAKRREAERGHPLCLLGLEIRGSDRVAIDQPELH
jgi:hypothetical protein